MDTFIVHTAQFPSPFAQKVTTHLSASPTPETWGTWEHFGVTDPLKGNHMFSSLFNWMCAAKILRNKPLHICTKRSSANFIQEWRSRETKGKSNVIVRSPQNEKKETPTTSLTFVYSLRAFAIIVLPASLGARINDSYTLQSQIWTPPPKNKAILVFPGFARLVSHNFA